MIRFQALGTSGLRGDSGEEIDAILRQPKRLALLAYLAIGTPGLRRRDTLLGVFWPELDSDNARSALRQTTHFLRAALGKDAVIARGDAELGIDGARLWCDAAAFEAALAAGKPAEALELYRGDLLPGLYITEAPEFERWLEGQRARLKDRAAGAAWQIAEDPLTDPTLAATMARRAAAFAPDDEIAVRRLIALLAGIGDRTGAIHAFESHVERLLRELLTGKRRSSRRPPLHPESHLSLHHVTAMPPAGASG